MTKHNSVFDEIAWRQSARGRPAYTQISASFPARDQVTLNFGNQFAGRIVRVRFRIGTDSIIARLGWEIDDNEVSGATNTLFPALVPEPTTCTARAAIEPSRVVESYVPPVRSLGPADQQVCIANDAQ